MEFSEWISKEYVEWRGNAIGHEGSVSAFAKWVGVPQSIMSYWLSGQKVPTSAKAINALVTRFGGEVYDVLDITPPIDIEIENFHALQEITAVLKDIPKDKHGELVFAVRAWAAQQGYIVHKKPESE